MKKKGLLLIVLLLIPLLLTGCGANNESPENVCKAMLTKLISGNFEGTKDIFYHKDAYFSEDAFAKLAEEKGLLLNGVKSYKVKEVGDEITSEGKTTVKVSYELDGKGAFTFNTIKDGDKWYVYDESFYNGDIKIAVPKGTNVVFDGKKLKDKKTEKQNVIIRHKEGSFSTTIEDVDVDLYTIKKVIKGEYPIVVSKGDNEIKENIGSYSAYKTSDKGNYTYRTMVKDGVSIITYIVNVPSSNKSAVSFVNDYYKNIYKAANEGKEFKDVEKYYDSKSNNISGMTTTYNYLLRQAKTSYTENYKASFKVDKVYDYGDYVGITGAVDYSYDFKVGKNTSKKENTKNSIIILKKADKNYLVYGGSNYLPN